MSASDNARGVSIPLFLLVGLGVGAAYSSTIYDLSSLLGLSSIAAAQDFTASAAVGMGSAVYPPAPVELELEGVQAMAKQPLWLQRQR